MSQANTMQSGRKWCFITLALFLAATSAAHAQPTFSKVFTPDTIGPGSVSTITFTIFNGTGAPVTDLAFTDVLPTVPGDVDIATPSNAMTDCDDGVVSAPDGGGTITFSDGRLGNGQTCTITVDVTADTAGVHTNLTGNLTSSAGNSGTATDDLNVVTTLPGFSKSFAPSSVPLGGRSTLTFLIDNMFNAMRVGNLEFVDNLPTGMVIADPSNAFTNCVSASAPDTTLIAVPGTDVIDLDADGSTFLPGFEVLPAFGTCTVIVDVVATAGGDLDNLTSDLLADFTSAGKASATLEVTVTDLAIQKAFTDDPVAPGGTVTLDFQIDNFDRIFSATGVAFTDSLATALPGLTFSSLLSNDCGGSVMGVGTTTITFTGGTIAPEGFCTISVSLAVPAAATPGSYTNTTSTVTGTVDSSPVVGNMASDDLFVSPAPVLTKTFIGDPVNPGDTVTLQFTITNTSATSGATDITFDDELTDGGPGTGFLPFPLSVVLPATPCGAGSSLGFIFPDTDRQGLRLTGGSLDPAGMPDDSCTFDVTVTIPADFNPGIYTNTTGEISATVDGATRIGMPASDDIEVIAAPSLTKAFTDDPAAPGGTVTLEFFLSYNANATGNATGVTFTDDLANLVPAIAGLAASAGQLPVTGLCPGGDGTLAGSVGDTLLTFSGATFMPGDDCTFSLTLDVPAATTAGVYTNTTSGVGAMVNGTPTTSAAASDDLEVGGMLFSKEFLGNPAFPGEVLTLRFTLENISAVTATAIGFTDSLFSVASLEATDPALADDCGGTLTVLTIPGTGSFLTYAGGSLAAGLTCNLDVEVTVPATAADGVYENFVSGVSYMLGATPGFDGPAVDDLIVDSDQLSLFKEFTDDPVNPGDTVTLEFNLTNLDPDNAVTLIDFTDDFGVELPGVTFDSIENDDCGGALAGLGTDTISYTGGSLGMGGSCTLTVNLTVPGGAAAGFYTNTTSGVTGDISGSAVTGDAASDLLEVVDLLSFSKSFDGPTTATGTAILTFTITNPGTSTAAGLSFTDNLDDVITGLMITDTTLDDPPCGVGSSLAGTGTSFLTFSNGELPPMGGTCSFRVEVTVPSGIAAGTYPNVTSDLFQGASVVADPATADLTIEPAPTFAKAFSPNPILAGLTSTLTFTIDNSASALAADSLAFTDDLMSVVVVTTPSVTSNTCGGTLTADAGTDSISLTGGSVAAGATCTIEIDVTSTTSGAHPNTTGDLTSTSGNSGTATDTLTVIPAADLSVTKTDGVTTATPGGSLTYTITVANAGPSQDPALVLNDTFPADLTCTYTSVAVGGASGNTAAGAGNLSETLSMPAGSSVTYTVSCNIASDATGTLSNTASIIPSITDTNPLNNTANDGDTVLVASADLAITKDDGVTSAVPGQDSVIYTIVASNNGPSDDPSVSVTDTFPAVLSCTYTSVAAGGATGNTAAGAGDLAETLSMPAGSSVTYTVNCTIDAGATGTLSNTANISGSVTDPNSGNDSATDSDTALTPEADLEITKTDGVTTATPGGSVTYTIVATNNGPSDDPSVSVADTFPADLTCTYASVAAGGATGNTAAGAGDIADTLSMPSGSSVTYTVNCSIDAAATGTLSNTATIASSVTDPSAGNNSATDGDTVLAPEADLQITKTDGVTTATPGGSLTYTIVVSNAGPSDEPAAAVADTFPADLTCTYTSVAAGGATGNTAAGAGDIADTLSLPAGSSVTYTATCDIDAAATGTLSNTATVTESVTDPDGGNNSATDGDTVLVAEADLSITKTDGVTTATPGGSVTYTIVVANAGPSDDPAAAVADTFPADLTCTYTSVAAGGATGNTAAGAGDIADTLSLPAGSSVTYTATCDIDAAATGTLSNTATVTESVTDPDSGNNSATDDDTVLAAEADLSITKTDGVTAATPGESVTYTIVVANAGPSDDPAAAIADTFPADLTCTYTSVAAGGATGNAAAGAGDIADTLSLPAGSSVTYTATCDIDAGATGTLSNTATVTASVTDPDTGNNSATDNDTVLGPEADLQITKTDGVTSAVPGETILTYTIVASNAGPSDDPAVAVADTFPADLTCTYTSVAAGGATGNTAAGAGDIADTVSLPAGSSVTYTATCSIIKTATGTLSNTATVTGSVSDPDAGNNSATDDDTVLDVEADLGITKEGPADVTVGDELTYTLTVTNNGPSATTGIMVDDPTPAGLTFVSATAPCAAGFPCDVGSLGLGGEITVDVTFEVPFDYAGATPIVNTATVSSGATDNVPGNDSATAETEVNFDTVPPEVTGIATNAGPLAECDTVRSPITSVQVTIEDDLSPILNADDTDSYLLLEAGPDRDFSTTDCTGAAGDDVEVGIVSLSLTDTPPTAIAGLNFPGAGLDAGIYRLLVCDAITDGPGNALDGDGDAAPGGDFVLSFFRADPLNLFDNGHFDDCPFDRGSVTLDPWVPATTPPNTITPATPGADDFESSPLSASARVAHSAAATSSLAQCVPVEAGVAYDLAARWRFDPPMGALAQFEQTCEFFDAAACAGTSLGSTSSATIIEDEGGAWQMIAGEVVAAAGAVSALCDFAVEPVGADPNFDLYLDDLSLKSGGVVSLIFTDGFESGDTSAWSSTTP